MLLTKLLNSIGLPVLLKFVKGSLTGIDNDAVKKAVSSINDVNKAIEDKKLSLENIKLQSSEEEIDVKTLSIINDAIRCDLNADSNFVKFWRPCFGYAVSIAWLLNMFTICYVILTDRENAAMIISAIVETTSLWAIALGVLGISVINRTKEKKNNNPINH
jgi:hypothetical protein